MVLWELELSKRPAAFYLSLFPSHSLSFSISQSVCFDPVCFISQLIWSAVSQSEDRKGGRGEKRQKREKLKSCPGNESLGAWGVRRGQREPTGRHLTPLTPLSPTLLSSVVSFLSHCRRREMVRRMFTRLYSEEKTRALEQAHKQIISVPCTSAFKPHKSAPSFKPRRRGPAFDVLSLWLRTRCLLTCTG